MLRMITVRYNNILQSHPIKLLNCPEREVEESIGRYWVKLRYPNVKDDYSIR